MYAALCDLYEKNIEELEDAYEGEIVALKDKYQKYLMITTICMSA